MAMERKIRSLKSTISEVASSPRRSENISVIEEVLEIHRAMEEWGEMRHELYKWEIKRGKEGDHLWLSDGKVIDLEMQRDKAGKVGER